MRLILKAKPLPMWSVRTHGGKKMMKTPEGWMPVKRPAVKKNLADLSYVKERFKRRESGDGGPIDIESFGQLDTLLTKTRVGFISAGKNPEIEEDLSLSDADIKKRDAKLKADLKRLGYLYTNATGHYGGLPEGSMMVLAHDAQKDDIVKLGERYNQDSILFTDSGHSEMIMTTGDRKGAIDAQGDGYEMVPKADDFFTEIDIKGKKAKFTMVLEWAKSLMRHFVRVFM